ncbi:Hypothetical protein NGAL_HAMBI2427_50190 [Neorhizobium galegae bv. orientalis]|jgi:type II secretory pathway component PulM|uniref:Uncharacterized protein n=2 Tax=Neorhizobium galegae TaxID=399 RepID=A0A068T1Q7_NEOGA|nr:hypothetical protein [Neorhizobium galegae]KAB1083764.1 hypothetical protein F4V91_30375 [Neorhizobium galegae]CDN52024.1 Hypothetical protein RG540_PA13480 [Neorhizobium galegae bv. orientalis str. HAMBI 540]CDZ53174.1 Hypothetical protein NGAL_HAMBI2427_50190 [Neorhizobium galegae bv. orientalis]
MSDHRNVPSVLQRMTEDVEAGYGSTVLSSPTAKMDFLRAQLAQRGLASERMSWRLLLLEWQYDLAVLFGNVGDWIRYIDRRFNRTDV